MKKLRLFVTGVLAASLLLVGAPKAVDAAVAPHQCSNHYRYEWEPSPVAESVGSRAVCTRTSPGYYIAICTICYSSYAQSRTWTYNTSHNIVEYWRGCDNVYLTFEYKCTRCDYNDGVRKIPCNGIHPWSLTH